MAQLVYCPTCGGKMSSNAQTCPHCGEWDFFREVPAKYENKLRCAHCDGEGWVWAHTEYSGIAVSPCFIKKYSDDPNYVVWKFDEFTSPVAFENHSQKARLNLRCCLRDKDYELKILRGGFIELHYEQAICDHCEGEGSIIEIHDGIKRIDIRKPV